MHGQPHNRSELTLNSTAQRKRTC